MKDVKNENENKNENEPILPSFLKYETGFYCLIIGYIMRYVSIIFWFIMFVGILLIILRFLWGRGLTDEEKAQLKAEQAKAGAIKCRHCGSTDVEFMGQNKKGFSVGKAVAGGIMTGGIGTLAGFAGKKGKKEWHCRNCGRTFTTKK